MFSGFVSSKIYDKRDLILICKFFPFWILTFVVEHYMECTFNLLIVYTFNKILGKTYFSDQCRIVTKCGVTVCMLSE